MPFVPNVLLRAKARLALKNNFHIALLAALLANLPTLLASVLSSIAFSPVYTILLRFSSGNISEDVMWLSLRRQMERPEVMWLLIVTVVSFFLLPFLTVGWHRYTLRLLRGEEAGPGDVVSCLSAFWRAVWLNILRALYLLLWSLPGILGMSGTLLLTLQAYQSGSRVLLSVANVLYYAAAVLMAWLSLRALVRSSMAFARMADAPEKPALQCLRESLEMLKGRSVQYLSMMLFFMLLLIAAGFVVTMLAGLSEFLGLTVSMLVELAVNVYAITSYMAFYEACLAAPGSGQEEGGVPVAEGEVLNDEPEQPAPEGEVLNNEPEKPAQEDPFRVEEKEP